MIRYSEHFEESGETMLAHACRMGLEGVISKQIDAPYHSGRTLDWIKSKCTLRQEFIIIGYLASAATGRGLRSILVGYRKNGKLEMPGGLERDFRRRPEMTSSASWKSSRQNRRPSRDWKKGEGCRLGAARIGGGSGIPGMDERWHSAPGLVSGTARRQAGKGSCKGMPVAPSDYRKNRAA